MLNSRTKDSDHYSFFEMPVEIDWEIQSLLSKADLAVGKLAGIMEIIDTPIMFFPIFIKYESVLSCHLDGNKASLWDVLQYESNSIRGFIPDVFEVIRYIEELGHGYQQIMTRPLSCSLLHTIRDSLSCQTAIRNIGHKLSPEIINAPTLNEMDTNFSPLETFFQSEEIPLPHLIKTGLVYAYIEKTCPFGSFNSRMARLLNSLILSHYQILRQPILYLSLYFNRHSQSYFSLIHSLRGNTGREDWLKFYLAGIYEISNDAISMVHSILKMHQEHMERVKGLGSKGVLLLNCLYHKPVVTVNTIKDVLDVTYSTANRVANAFLEAGIIENVSGTSRSRAYGYNQYLQMFQKNSS